MHGMIRITTSDPAYRRIMNEKTHANYNSWRSGGKKPAWQAIADGAWAGEPAFVLGGGPSLRGFAFSRLAGRHVVAVNRAFEYAPFAEVLYSMDIRYYRWLLNGAIAGTREMYLRFAGIRIWLDLFNYTYGPEVRYVPGIGPEGISRSLKEGIYHSNNSGYGGIQIAIVLKANPIYLLGFDLNATGKTHFHSGYPRTNRVSINERFRGGFTRLARPARAAGIRIVNLSASSTLRCFEFSSIDEVLDDHNERLEDAVIPTETGAPPEVGGLTDRRVADVRGGEGLP